MCAIFIITQEFKSEENKENKENKKNKENEGDKGDEGKYIITYSAFLAFFLVKTERK
jgi:hypothetical protein